MVRKGKKRTAKAAKATAAKHPSSKAPQKAAKNKTLWFKYPEDQNLPAALHSW